MNDCIRGCTYVYVIIIIIIIYSLLGNKNKNKQTYGRQKKRIDTQIDMVHKLTFGLHIITERLGLRMPNIRYMNIICEYAHII